MTPAVLAILVFVLNGDPVLMFGPMPKEKCESLLKEAPSAREGEKAGCDSPQDVRSKLEGMQDDESEVLPLEMREGKRNS